MCLAHLLSGPLERLTDLDGRANVQGGLLPVVGTLNLDDKEVATVTFAQLRPRIELLQTKDVIRRSVMFQEVLALIATSANPHGWPPNAMQTYCFDTSPTRTRTCRTSLR